MRYSFKWRLINRCNFQCSYCINSNAAELYESREQERERLLRQSSQIATLIDSLGDDYESASILLIGGEISLLPEEEMKLIIDNLTKSKKLKAIHITSNFTAPYQWFSDLYDYCKCKDVRFTVVASFHEEMFDMNKFAEKAIQMDKKFNADGNHDFTIEFVVTKTNYNTFAPKFVKYAKESGIPHLIDYDRHDSWTEEEKIYKSNKSLTSSARTMKCNTEDTFGYTCSNNTYQTTVKPDGKLFGTVCSRSLPYGILGLTKKIDLKTKSCHLHQCSCCGRLRIVRPDGSVYYDVTTLDEIDHEELND